MVWSARSYWFKAMVEKAVETKNMRTYLKWKFGDIHDHGLDEKMVERCEELYQDLYNDKHIDEED